ncbi:MAG: dodecin domain-containing protein [Deltaproteobacteria bacterium]|nr:dodecin domain-containing protein [Deltaproteobacteria bacterium]
MISARRFYALWACACGLWVCLLAASAPWDLEISLAVADLDSRFGLLISAFGEWPGWLLATASLVLLIATRKPDSAGRHLRPLAWAVLILSVGQAWLLTSSIKYFWGRVRFVHLAADLAGYTPFYLPAGIGAGLSFPSGHVAMAFVSAPLPFFLYRRGSAAAFAAACAAVALYGGGVAWGRIVSGSHYLTDTLFSAGLALLAAPLLLRWLTRRGAGSREAVDTGPEQWDAGRQENDKNGRQIMSDSIYKVIELVGTSSSSWEDAVKNCIETAAKSLEDIRIGEIIDLDAKVENNKVVAYRAKVKISFKYHKE